VSASGKGPSRRYQPSGWSERLVPLILLLLLIVLIGTVVFVILSALGILPFA